MAAALRQVPSPVNRLTVMPLIVFCLLFSCLQLEMTSTSTSEFPPSSSSATDGEEVHEIETSDIFFASFFFVGMPAFMWFYCVAKAREYTSVISEAYSSREEPGTESVQMTAAALV